MNTTMTIVRSLAQVFDALPDTCMGCLGGLLPLTGMEPAERGGTNTFRFFRFNTCFPEPALNILFRQAVLSGRPDSTSGPSLKTPFQPVIYQTLNLQVYA